MNIDMEQGKTTKPVITQSNIDEKSKKEAKTFFD